MQAEPEGTTTAITSITSTPTTPPPAAAAARDNLAGAAETAQDTSQNKDVEKQ